MFEGMKPLAQQQIDWRKHRHAHTVQWVPLQSFQRGSASKRARLDMQLHGIGMKVLIDVFERDSGPLIEFEFPASTADGVQAVSPLFQNVSRLRNALRCYKKIQVELRAQFRL